MRFDHGGSVKKKAGAHAHVTNRAVKIFMMQSGDTHDKSISKNFVQMLRKNAQGVFSRHVGVITKLKDVLFLKRDHMMFPQKQDWKYAA